MTEEEHTPKSRKCKIATDPRQMPHTGDKGMRNRPVISPLGEDVVDGGVVDFGLPSRAVGTGKHVYGMPVSSTDKMRLKTR